MRITLCFFLFILFGSCASTSDEVGGETFQIIDLTEKRDFSITALFESVEIIELETTDKFLGNIKKLIYTKNRFYILHSISFLQDEISVFGDDGKFLYDVGRKGNGPGEFNQISDFHVYLDKIYLLDPALKAILVYSEQQFQNKIVIPSNFHHLAVKENKIYTFDPMDFYSKDDPSAPLGYAIYAYDFEGNVLNKYFPIDYDMKSARIRIGMTSSLFTSDNTVYYKNWMKPELYMIDSESFEKTYEFKFQGQVLSIDEIPKFNNEGKVEEELAYYQRHSHINRYVSENDKMVLCTYRDNDTNHWLFYNKSNGRQLNGNILESDYFPASTNTMTEEYFIDCVEASNLIEQIPTITKNGELFSANQIAQIKNISSDANTIIFKYRFREIWR